MEKNVARGTVEDGPPYPPREVLEEWEKSGLKQILTWVKEGKMTPAEALGDSPQRLNNGKGTKMNQQYGVNEVLQALADNKPGSRMKLGAVIRALQAD
jgi:hypothetical protein